MAGILFVDSDSGTVLAGFHPKLGKLSGFGGKAQDNETAAETAVREVVEELFGIFTLEPIHRTALMSQLTRTQDGKAKVRVYESYSLFIEPLSTLFAFTDFLSKNGYFSPFYLELPTNIHELLYLRIVPETGEITVLTRFWIKDRTEQRHLLADEFYEDISILF
jgi:hypothetical protein